MKKIACLFALWSFVFCAFCKNKQINANEVGLLIIDAQKWYIPGHSESMYALWNIGGQPRQAPELIAAMNAVLSWANQHKLTTFVTYEGVDTAAYDLPDELKYNLNINITTHYIKTFYDATKHIDFYQKIKKSGIKKWIVIGAETDVCVYQTVKGLLDKDFQVTVVAEAVYSGKNYTEISLNNLVTFGANVIHIADLYSGKTLFNNTTKNIEKPLSQNHLKLTIVTNSDEQIDVNSGSFQRLQFLKKFAEIIHLPVEEINAKDLVLETDHNEKERLLAGFITPDIYSKIETKSSGGVRVVSDCVVNTHYNNMPKQWHHNTLKMIAYDLMETVNWYALNPEKLDGWKKDWKIALTKGTLTYVELLQNIE